MTATEDAINARMHDIWVANPVLTWDAAHDLAAQQVRSEANVATIDAGKAEEDAWKAGGRPGGLEALLNNTWRDLAKAPEDPEKTLREMTTDGGRLSKEAIGRIKKAQAEDAKAARDQRAAEGFVG